MTDVLLTIAAVIMVLMFILYGAVTILIFKVFRDTWRKIKEMPAEELKNKRYR